MNAERWSNILSVERAFRAGSPLAGGQPLEAYIEVAARCNLRCIMCPITVDPRYQPGSGSPGLLQPEHFECLRPLFPTLQRVYLFGLGEPMLNPHLFDYAAQLSDAGVEVWITTNATLVGDHEAEALVQSGVYRVSVSIDGATRETYERIRRGANWEHLMRGLEALGRVRRRRGRPRFVMLMVGMASNLEEVPGLVDLAAAVGADGVFVEMIYDWPDPKLHEVYRREHPARLGEDRVRELVAEGRRRAAELGLDFHCRLDDWGEAVPPLVQLGRTPESPPRAPDRGSLSLAFPCSEPWQMINVSAAGHVRTCCFNGRVYGELAESTFEEIWHGEPYNELRRLHAARRSPPECADCVRSWRVKRSPHLLPPEVETEVPRVDEWASNGAGPRLIAPADGELSAGSELVIAGWLRRRSRIARWLEKWGWIQDEAPALPEVWLDDTLLARVKDLGVLDGDRFALVAPIDFVSEGSHRLTLRAPSSDGSPGSPCTVWDLRHLQTGAIEEDRASQWQGEDSADLAAVSRLAFHVDLAREQRRPRLRLDGADHPLAEWICGTYGNAWRGIAVVDLAEVAPGPHRLELDLGQERPYCRRIHRLGVRESDLDCQPS